MDPLSKLPLECLQLILRILDKEYNHSSLAALLSANKYIASVTLPYLYRRPEPQNYFFSFKLVRTLATCHLSNNHSQLLCLAFGFDTTTKTTTTPACVTSFFNYLTQIRHLHMEYPAFNLESIWSEVDPPPVAISEYLQGQEFERLCQQDGLSPSFVKYIAAEKEYYLHQYVQLILYRDIVWSVVSSNLGQL
ncbi:hypothetical protein BGX33_010742 [Mortierella sp. NVP41]|nr:hypothetical protein BGX33_010742 [Mortierella sp. NVP41]